MHSACRWRPSCSPLQTRPGVANLIRIYAGVVDETPEQVVQRMAGRDTQQFKEELAELLVATLDPVQQRMQELGQDPAQVDAILADGRARASALANATMDHVRTVVGLH